MGSSIGPPPSTQIGVLPHKDHLPLGQSGLPDESESAKLEQFENRLIEAVERDSFAILAVVLTGGGEREFVFHSKDRAGFIDRLTHMPQEQARYPLNIQAYDDPAWDYDAAVTLPYRQQG